MSFLKISRADKRQLVRKTVTKGYFSLCLGVDLMWVLCVWKVHIVLPYLFDFSLLKGQCCSDTSDCIAKEETTSF